MLPLPFKQRSCKAIKIPGNKERRSCLREDSCLVDSKSRRLCSPSSSRHSLWRVRRIGATLLCLLAVFIPGSSFPRAVCHGVGLCKTLLLLHRNLRGLRQLAEMGWVLFLQSKGLMSRVGPERREWSGVCSSDGMMLCCPVCPPISPSVHPVVVITPRKGEMLFRNVDVQLQRDFLLH